MFTLKGKIIAVIGAGSGIGEAVALGAAAQGAAYVAPASFMSRQAT